MWLLSKDSTWVQEFPRKLAKGVFFGAGSRAQVLVRCSEPGTFPLKNQIDTYQFTNVDPGQVMMYAKVTGNSTDMEQPVTVQAQRPRYLQDLVNIPDDDIWDPEVAEPQNQYNGKPLELPGYQMKRGKAISQNMSYDVPAGTPGATPIWPMAFVRQPVRFVINNQTFSHSLPQATFPVAQVIESLVVGVDTHSWHMHTHPVQFVEFVGIPDYKERWGGYFEIGDWADVLQLPDRVYDVRRAGATVRVRFQTDCYSGPLVVHCHVLYHEDLGMMTWFNSTGPDHTTNPKFDNDGIFKHPPSQCLKPGHQCAPAHCTDYTYA